MKLAGPWTTAQRGVVTAFVVGLVIYLSIRLFRNRAYISDPQPHVASRAGEVEDRLDPNKASWHELAAMPLIGERRAKDIVAFRESFVAIHPGTLAFEKPSDLLHIRGIGATMLEQIEPYLRFPASPTSRPVQ